MRNLENLEGTSKEHFISYYMKKQGCEWLKCYHKRWEYALPCFVVYVRTQNKHCDGANLTVCGSTGTLWDVHSWQLVGLSRETFILSLLLLAFLCSCMARDKSDFWDEGVQYKATFKFLMPLYAHRGKQIALKSKLWSCPLSWLSVMH